MRIIPPLTSEAAWQAYDTFIRSIMPRVDAVDLLRHARDKHDKRWRERERLKHEIRHRRITENDFEG